MGILISPAEPKELHAIGTTSSLPETRGVDFMWTGNRKLYGVQRKTLSDLIGSLDGRLNDALTKTTSLDVSILLLEGPFKWTRDGNWTGRLVGGRSFTKTQLWGLMSSIRSRGHWVVEVESITETAQFLLYLYQWSQKTKHTALDRAPKVRSPWGGSTETDRQAWAICVLCPGIGYDTARKLVEANGGRVPLELTMSLEEVAKVPGWGPKRVKVLADAFGVGRG